MAFLYTKNTAELVLENYIIFTLRRKSIKYLKFFLTLNRTVQVFKTLLMLQKNKVPSYSHNLDMYVSLGYDTDGVTSWWERTGYRVVMEKQTFPIELNSPL